jgi:hypothetical protein
MHYWTGVAILCAIFLSLKRVPLTISNSDESSPNSPLKLARERLTMFHKSSLEVSRWLCRSVSLFSRSVIESSRRFARLMASWVLRTDNDTCVKAAALYSGGNAPYRNQEAEMFFIIELSYLKAVLYLK